jgi:hypothetical protein
MTIPTLPTKADFAAWCPAIKGTHFVSLRFNSKEPMDILRAERRLRWFDAKLDRRLLGSNWASKPPTARTHFLAIPEGRLSRPGSSFVADLHYHILLRWPPPGRHTPRDMTDARHFVKRLWTSCVPAGDSDVKDIYAIGGVAGYITKYIDDISSLGAEYYVLAPMNRS